MNPILYIRTRLLRCTQVEMALMLGVPQNRISRWESGRLEPRLTSLKSLREELIARGHEWDDRWFFEVPQQVDLRQKEAA